LTGERINYDDVLVHHLYHNPFSGRTLYGVEFETLNCFVALKGDKENKQVEGTDWQMYQDQFVYMWQQFKLGNFEEATRFWNDNDPRFQQKFLRDLRSRRYLRYWVLNL